MSCFQNCEKKLRQKRHLNMKKSDLNVKIKSDVEKMTINMKIDLKREKI